MKYIPYTFIALFNLITFALCDDSINNINLSETSFSLKTESVDNIIAKQVINKNNVLFEYLVPLNLKLCLQSPRNNFFTFNKLLIYRNNKLIFNCVCTTQKIDKNNDIMLDELEESLISGIQSGYLISADYKKGILYIVLKTDENKLFFNSLHYFTLKDLSSM